jgi:hypothetical protein
MELCRLVRRLGKMSKIEKEVKISCVRIENKTKLEIIKLKLYPKLFLSPYFLCWILRSRMAINDQSRPEFFAKKQCIVEFDIAINLDLFVLFSQEQSRNRLIRRY